MQVCSFAYKATKNTVKYFILKPLLTNFCCAELQLVRPAIQNEMRQAIMSGISPENPVVFRAQSYVIVYLLRQDW